MADTKKQLKEIPALTAETLATWGTNPISADGNKPHRAPSSTVLADLDRIMALDETNEHDGIGVLAAWIQAITEEHDQAGTPLELPDNTVAARCKWLTNQLDWCKNRGFEKELKKDINRLHAKLKHICRYREPYQPHCRYCTNPVQGIDTDGNTTQDWNQASYGRCTGCGITYPKGPALTALAQLQDLTEKELSNRLNIPRPTMRRYLAKWKKQGHLTPSGQQGQALTYPLTKVHKLLQKE